MKKVVLVVAVCLTIVCGFLLLPFNDRKTEEVNATYLRVHIRANSNDECDQKVKYEIRDIIVSYLTPKLENVSGLENAKQIISGELENISSLASDHLAKKGFCYLAKAKLNTEYFPTRSYEELTLKDGFYDALIVELGSAEGNNWWCVIYPPLCFSEKTSKDNVEYASLIKEIIEKRK